MMNKKIIILLAIVVMAFGIDNFSARLARLEYNAIDLADRRERLAALEQKSLRIDVLEQQMAEAQRKIYSLKQHIAQLRLTQKRAHILEDMFLPVLQERGLKIFRSSRATEDMESVFISSSYVHKNSNFCLQKFLSIGGAENGDRYRFLIKFPQLNFDLLKDKKILAAVLYLRQVHNENIPQDKLSWDETIQMYAVKKNWNQFPRASGTIHNGEVTWMEARGSEEPWAVPGAGSQTEDYDPTVLATSGPLLSAGVNEWAAFVFTEEGLQRLAAWGQDKNALNEGFLFISSSEDADEHMISFYSNMSENPQDRPYVEIYYTELQGKNQEETAR